MSNRSTISSLPDLDEVYKNILASFDPASKRLVHAGRDLLRAWINVAEATKVYADALEKLGLAGSNCGGETKEIGQCLLQISEAMKELNKNEKNTVGFFESQVLIPTEANLDQDSKVIIEQRKLYEKKLKQMIDRVKRDKKKGVPTGESERMLIDYQSDCVKQALTEEKKRYTYMLDRHCALATRQLQYYRTAYQFYERSIQKWKEACANPEELSAAALAALDAAILPYATQSSVTLSTVSRLDGRSLGNEETDTISNSLPPTPTAREQGVGSFHVHEGEKAKAAVQSTGVLLNNQQQEHYANGSKHTPETTRPQSDRLSNDQPSTGSSTVSNATTGESPPIVQQRSTSASSFAKNVAPKNSNGAQVPVDGSPAMRKENSDYAIAVKQRRPVTMIKEDSISTSGSVQNSERSSPVRRHAVAMFTYTHSGSNQLAFREGDTILVIQDGQQGWQFGENLATGKRGWYPASFIKPSDIDPRTSYGLQSLMKPRSNSSSATGIATNGSEYSGSNGFNGNGFKHSPRTANGGPDTNDQASAKSGRAVSMIVLQSANDHPTPPARRLAPPPPATGHSPVTAIAAEDGVVYVDENNADVHTINYDTVPKHNPFSHVRLRQVIKTDGTPKKYG